MMEYLAALEGSAFSTWLRESSSIWAYPTVLTLHTVGLAVVVGANWAIDLRVLGLARAIPLDALASTFRIMWIGFWVNAVSGVMLFAADPTTKGTTRLFMGKLVLIAAAVTVMIATKRLLYGRAARAGGATRSAKALAVASLVLWVSAIAAGRLMAYI
ncbi:MAG TPA: hypothetical protein VFV95_17250 [Vicinamibacterales bacterium]|nr:hypothetical protein [Vicinamibacterales bacterium]